MLVSPLSSTASLDTRRRHAARQLAAVDTPVTTGHSPPPREQEQLIAQLEMDYQADQQPQPASEGFHPSPFQHIPLTTEDPHPAPPSAHPSARSGATSLRLGTKRATVERIKVLTNHLSNPEAQAELRGLVTELDVALAASAAARSSHSDDGPESVTRNPYLLRTAEFTPAPDLFAVYQDEGFDNAMHNLPQPPHEREQPEDFQARPHPMDEAIRTSTPRKDKSSVTPSLQADQPAATSTSAASRGRKPLTLKPGYIAGLTHDVPPHLAITTQDERLRQPELGPQPLANRNRDSIGGERAPSASATLPPYSRGASSGLRGSMSNPQPHVQLGRWRSAVPTPLHTASTMRTPAIHFEDDRAPHGRQEPPCLSVRPVSKPRNDFPGVADDGLEWRRQQVIAQQLREQEDARFRADLQEQKYNLRLQRVLQQMSLENEFLELANPRVSEHLLQRHRQYELLLDEQRAYRNRRDGTCQAVHGRGSRTVQAL
ncbi:hypothetical protein BKA70DRAFT_1239241 [Coprinopsis sp. MPI-PUGE-AT-0042]|nr:hypothetical protein BKA70DRAFT_1239241 [Coprinopsis sp. MPI-PUGE-AT-0042]